MFGPVCGLIVKIRLSPLTMLVQIILAATIETKSREVNCSMISGSSESPGSECVVRAAG